MRGFNDIETLSGGKDQWQTMVVEIQDGSARMNRVPAEILEADGTDGIRNPAKVERHTRS